MNSTYIYAGTLAKTLQRKLLSENQLELILSAKTVDEMKRGLEDTYLAPYMSRFEKQGLSGILEDTIKDTKKELQETEPEKGLLDVLWLKYDFYNLRTCIKSKIANLNQEETLAKCFESGLFSPRNILTAYNEHTLSTLHPRLAEAEKEAEKYKEIGDIDLAINKQYLLAASEYKHPFVKEYVTILIDLFNLKSQLRLKTSHEKHPKDIFIQKGSFVKKDTEDKTKILKLLSRFGGDAIWKKAIEKFTDHGDYSLLDRASEEYLSLWLKTKSFELFSPAPLFEYFNAKKNNAQLINSIYAGKKVGIPENDLRTWLRKLHT